MKLLVLSVILAFAVTQLLAADVTWGARQPGDKLILEKSYEIKGSVLQITKYDANVITGPALITFANLTDTYKKKGKGAIARLISGGPGQTFMNMNFKSQRGEGISFLVQLYGR